MSGATYLTGGGRLSMPLARKGSTYRSTCAPTDAGTEIMRFRYAVVGFCFVVAAILMVVSANSKPDTGECRNWSARSVTNLLMLCVLKSAVDEPLDIGTRPIEQHRQTGR